MNCQSLGDPGQGGEQIAGRLQLARARDPIVDRALRLPVDDQAVNRFSCGMCGIQGERLIRQRLGFQPIGFHNGLCMLDQGIGQNGAGERVFLIQFVGLAQSLERFGGLPLREELLAFRD